MGPLGVLVSILLLLSNDIPITYMDCQFNEYILQSLNDGMIQWLNKSMTQWFNDSIPRRPHP